MTDYLECANIHKGISSKKKTNLIEMIVYGHITNQINKISPVHISKNERNQILKQNEMNVRKLPGHGTGLTRKKIMASTDSRECAIRIREWIVQ